MTATVRLISWSRGPPDLMARLSVFLMLIVISCLLAGVYGALHNQVSYSISPEYFHNLLFESTGVSGDGNPRVGAAQVGFAGTWWMGLVTGVPLATLALFLRGPERAMFRAYFVSVLVIIALSAAFGMASLTLDVPPGALAPEGVTDPGAFLRAALLHSYSYLSGIVALVAGLGVMGVTVWRSRRDG